MNPDELTRLRGTLLSRREELLDVERMSADAADTAELDQSRIGRLSRVDALQRQAMSRETQRRRQDELKRIAAALVRMDADDYGYCETCGEEIGSARLDIDPAATRCIKCATEAEDKP